ncbi:MAG: conjugal transfer protein TraF [Planctomycetota bacterium]
MKPGRVAHCFYALLLSFSPGLHAEEFHVVGARAMGMGGAGVAVTRGVLSSYWNPAALCPPADPDPVDFFEVALPLAVMGVASRDVLRELDEAVDLSGQVDFSAIEARLVAGKPLTETQLQDLLILAGELPGLEAAGAGFLADVSLGLGLHRDRFAFNIVGLYSAGAATRLDRSNLALGSRGIEGFIPPGKGQPATPGGLLLANDLVKAGLLGRLQADRLVFLAEQAGINLDSDDFRRMIEDILEVNNEKFSGSAGDLITANQSGVEVSGILVQEYTASYAQPLAEWFGPSLLDTVSIGASLKVMNAKTFFSPFTLSSLGDFEGIAEELLTESREETSMNIGIDLGLLAQPADWVSFGLVGRNLNSPSFDFARAGDYVLRPQVRAGVGFYDLLPGLVLAADIDLTRNHTDALPGYESQQAAIGFEYSLLEGDHLFLRGGVSGNLANSEGATLHFGLGFNIAGASFDLAATATPRLVELPGTDEGSVREFPERAGFSVMLGCRVSF